MPYPGQVAGKTGHSDLLKNPDVQSFLDRCVDVPRPSAEELEETLLTDEYLYGTGTSELPSVVIAIDGSTYEAAADVHYPSRMVSYIKISAIALDMTKYNSLSNDGLPYVDPFEVNRLLQDTEALALALPSAYVVPEGCTSTIEGIRRETLTYLKSDATKLGENTLYDTFCELVRLIGRMKTKNSKEYVDLEKCPTGTCENVDPEQEYLVPTTEGHAVCPGCGKNMFATDILRFHESSSDTGSNAQSSNRIMSFLEKLLMCHYLLYVEAENPSLLNSISFILDGPLALFGETAMFHRAIQKLIHRIRMKTKSLGQFEPLILGISKTGRLADHFESIRNILDRSPQKHTLIFPVSDEYRYKYIEPSKDASKNHGAETYFGQDFFVRTSAGSQFIIGLPYPQADKSAPDFQGLKANLDNYDTKVACIDLVNEFESDLYSQSLVPITLAHQHASISLKPGGKVLDILTSKAMPS